MSFLSPQQINKELIGYAFDDVEAVVVRKIMRSSNITQVNNSIVSKILERPVNQGVDFWFDSRDVEVNLDLLEKLYELNVSDTDRKVNGSYYTPTNIISYIISATVHNIGSICDPACGSGAFLVEAAKYYHNHFGLTFQEIYSKYLFGVDILPTSVERTKLMLSLLAILHGEDLNFIFNFDVGDSLTYQWEKIAGAGFDYIVGNPPYVRTKNLRKDVRDNIKKWHTASFGNVDLYIPFFELAVHISSSTGRIGYITPSTYLTSFNAKVLRQYLIANKLPEKIVDFNGWQIFEGATTYTCITILSKTKNENLQFALVDTQDKIAHLSKLRFNSVKTDVLGESEWRLLSKEDAEKIFKLENTGSPLFKYVNRFVTGVATLSNDLFLVQDTGDAAFLTKEYRGKTFRIERAITKKIIKPNKVKDRVALENNTERIIYPYEIQNNRATILPEETLKKQYPMAYAYLLAIRSDLMLRDKGQKKYEAWYAYGRSQGLNNFGEKIILPMMGNRPSFISVHESDTLIYCGYAIYPKHSDDFVLLEKILNSDLMWFYLKKTSKNYSGGFKSFAKNYVKNFSIPDFSREEKNKLLSLDDQEEINSLLSQKYQLL